MGHPGLAAGEGKRQRLLEIRVGFRRRFVPDRQAGPAHKLGKTMKHYFFALSLGFAGLIFATEQAFAEGRMQCAKRDAVLAKLATGYGEVRQSIGLASGNAVMELFASADSGTWTITVTLPNGMTCLVASGQSFEEVAEELPAAGNPT